MPTFEEIKAARLAKKKKSQGDSGVATVAASEGKTELHDPKSLLKTHVKGKANGITPPKNAPAKSFTDDALRAVAIPHYSKLGKITKYSAVTTDGNIYTFPQNAAPEVKAYNAISFTTDQRKKTTNGSPILNDITVLGDTALISLLKPTLSEKTRIVTEVQYASELVSSNELVTLMNADIATLITPTVITTAEFAGTTLIVVEDNNTNS